MDKEGTPLKLIEMFDTVNTTWSKINSSELEYLNDPCTALLNNSLFIIGGCLTKKKKTTSNVAVLYLDRPLFQYSRSKCLSEKREKASKCK